MISQVHNVSKDTTSFTLENLKPATKYSLEVAAATNAGLGPFSKPVYKTTGEDGKFSSIFFKEINVYNYENNKV